MLQQPVFETLSGNSFLSFVCCFFELLPLFCCWYLC